jgi:hypothetical protein
VLPPTPTDAGGGAGRGGAGGGAGGGEQEGGGGGGGGGGGRTPSAAAGVSCGSAGAGVAGECSGEASVKDLKEGRVEELKEGRVKELKDAEQGAPILTVMGAEKEEEEGSLTQEAAREMDAAGEKKPLKKILKVADAHLLPLSRHTPTASLLPL